MKTVAISLTGEHKKFIEDNSIILSILIRERLEIVMKNNPDY